MTSLQPQKLDNNDNADNNNHNTYKNNKEIKNQVARNGAFPDGANGELSGKQEHVATTAA